MILMQRKIILIKSVPPIRPQQIKSKLYQKRTTFALLQFQYLNKNYNKNKHPILLKTFLWRPLLWSFALLQWLEPNPQYLWGMPVCFMYLIFSEMLLSIFYKDDLKARSLKISLAITTLWNITRKFYFSTTFKLGSSVLQQRLHELRLSYCTPGPLMPSPL